MNSEFEGKTRKQPYTNIRIDHYVKDLLDQTKVVSPEGIPMNTISQKIHGLVLHYHKIAK